MKSVNYKLLMVSLLFLGTLGFVSCEDDDDYDYNKIVPKVLGVTGPNAISAHGLAQYPFVYDVTYFRGGSKLEWTVTTDKGTGSATITTTSVGTFENKSASIVFPQRSEEDFATITIVETTLGGVKSAPYTYRVKLNPFCPYDMNAFAGNYSGTISRHSETVVMQKTANLNELKVFGLADFIQTSWEENWVSGDGSCIMEFSCGDKVTIKKQQIGVTDYPDTYLLEGEGTVDVAAKKITLTYKVFYTGGSTSSATTELSLVP